MPRTRSGVLNEKNRGEEAIQTDDRQKVLEMRAVRGEQDRQIQLLKADNDVGAARLMHTLSCS
ncbi:hypothetical protein X801_06845 [Opisthorchis viverrini]|uniref:Uncharacterized protein n=1 Tax=Opisthorchis viverrini TaxID=6198 RepID=A0A1S8WSA8_OPIVI|nr:hypothetical protein X801_06845 [Opisthorchis viverrini]